MRHLIADFLGVLSLFVLAYIGLSLPYLFGV